MSATICRSYDMHMTLGESLHYDSIRDLSQGVLENYRPLDGHSYNGVADAEDSVIFQHQQQQQQRK